MVPDDRSSGADPEGFLSIAALRSRAKAAASPSEFERGCSGPALLVHGDAGGAGGDLNKPASPGSGVLIVTLEGGATSAAARRYQGRAAFIAKRPGNPFPNMISLGRSTSNDVVIALDTISKLHGYFLRDGDAWFFTDYQSTNGTAINDKKLEKGERRLLADGDRFKLGLDVLATFLAPSSLYERVRGG